MLDFSWSELLVCLVVAVFAIGPKQLPDLMYQAGRALRRLQYMRFAVTRQMDEFMMLGDIKELQKSAPITQIDPETGKPIIEPNDEAEADESIFDIEPEYLPPEREQQNAEQEQPASAETGEQGQLKL